MCISIKNGYEHLDEIKILFTEYVNLLTENDKSFKKYLKIQNYDDELKNLSKKYALPKGRLYICYYDNNLAGCIALRKIDEDNCEMKRLYVRKEYQKKGIGSYLIDEIIKDAKEIGYKNILLDTLPFLKSAIYVYEQYGFKQILKYNDSPMEESIYMKLEL